MVALKRKPSDEAILLALVVVAVFAVSVGAALMFVPAGLLAFGALTLALALLALRSGK